MKNLTTLLLYSIIGFLCLIIAGLTIREIIGFGIIFGFIGGLLDELHRDFLNHKH